MNFVGIGPRGRSLSFFLAFDPGPFCGLASGPKLRAPRGGAVTAVWTLWGFALGIAAVWLYAAIRPRYGAGAGTAVRAGVAVWFFTSLLAIIAMRAMGLFAISVLALLWTLAECIAATLAGAWLYRETD